MIQLLVNRFNEPEELLGQLLDSIVGQQGAPEYSVIIGDDGSDAPLSDAFLSRYPFVRYEMLPHRGMSATRNALMDMADDEYVCFLDSDDLYVSMIGLHIISRHFPFDVFGSEFLEEKRSGETLLGYVSRKNDPYFLHGKCFRLQYLRDNQIRWDDSMERYGDVTFLWQAICLSQRYVYCDAPFYLWKWNPESMCRSERDHFFVTYHEAIHENVALVENFIGRGRLDLATRFATLIAYAAYVMTHMEPWERSGSRMALDMLADFATKYPELVVDSPELYREKCASHGCAGPDYDGFRPWLQSVIEQRS